MDENTHEVEVAGGTKRVTLDELKEAFETRADRERRANVAEQDAHAAQRMRADAQEYNNLLNQMAADPKRAMRHMALSFGHQIRFADEIEHAQPPSAQPEEDDMAGAENLVAGQPAPPPPAASAPFNNDVQVQQLKDEVRRLQEKTWETDARSTVKQLQDETPGGEDITFDEVLLFCQQQGLESVESGFKLLAFERLMEVDNTEPQLADLTADMAAGSTRPMPFTLDQGEGIDRTTWVQSKRYPNLKDIARKSMQQFLAGG